jgi:hypothetical protein
VKAHRFGTNGDDACGCRVPLRGTAVDCGYFLVPELRLKTFDHLVSAAVEPSVITLLGESLWSSATFRSLRVIIGGHALILSRWSPILAWVDSAASYLLRVAFLSPFSVLVVCSQDWRSMAWSGRAGGPSRQQLGGCEMMLFGGFTRRWSFTFCRLYLGGCADPCSYFFFLSAL